MNQSSLCDIIAEQTDRALWETGNALKCIPESCWARRFGDQPVWRHVYHMLHSLDLWFINPRDAAYREPPFHRQGLNGLTGGHSGPELSRVRLLDYFSAVSAKIDGHVRSLSDEDLLVRPGNCEYTRFTLILAQFRHLHTHMGMLMGFLLTETGRWPYVLGLEGEKGDSAAGLFYS